MSGQDLGVRTHLAISETWVGEVIERAEGRAVAALVAQPEMAADERGLVHGGFTFGLADYAAMVAVNDPNVVLGGAQTRFLAPVVVGQRMVAEAIVGERSGRKHTVSVSVTVDGTPVMTGELTCFVLDTHILGQEA